jgi:hypothetical protein
MTPVAVGYGLLWLLRSVDQISAFIEELPASVERLQEMPGMVGSIAQSIDVPGPGSDARQTGGWDFREPPARVRSRSGTEDKAANVPTYASGMRRPM